MHQVATWLVVSALIGCGPESQPGQQDPGEGPDGRSPSAGGGVKADGPAPAQDGGTTYEDGHYLFLSPLADRQGKTALLIVFPGAQVPARRYLGLARAVQQATSLRLGVGIARFTLKLPNPPEAELRLQEIEHRARKDCACKLAGERVLLAGHSMGGIIARDFVKPHGYGGLVLLASYLPDLPLSPDLGSYPAPVLTLGGELDGRTWVTRIAEESRKLGLLGAAEAASKPVVVVPRVNHQQFAGGDADAEDIPAEIPLALARQRIARVVADFAQARLAPGATPAESRLKAAVQQTRQLVSPYLEARELERGKWCRAAQENLVALKPQDTGLLEVSHQLHESTLSFLWSKPSIKTSGAKVKIEVPAYLTRAQDLMDASPGEPESALSLACKLKSQQAVQQHLPQASFGPPRTCAELNQQALQWALKRVGAAAKARYLARGAQLAFAGDRVLGAGFQWAAAKLELQRSQQAPVVVTVRSPALRSGTSAGLGLGGMHYCKLLSPARAVEWVLVEGLKP
jgi:pimeloyl-ACP methyl ester carboxylesterase